MTPIQVENATAADSLYCNVSRKDSESGSEISDVENVRRRTDDEGGECQTTLKRPRDDSVELQRETSLKVTKITIPAKSFYSNREVKPLSNHKKCIQISPPSQKKKTNQQGFPSNQKRYHSRGHAKGVGHKVRRSIVAPASRPGDASSLEFDLIVNAIHSEKLRNLMLSRHEKRIQMDKCHNIIRCAPNPIDLARPLSIISDNHDHGHDHNDGNSNLHHGRRASSAFSDPEFSDPENSDELGLLLKDTIGDASKRSASPNTSSETLPELTCPQTDDNSPPKPVVKRKFFKSGRSTPAPLEVRITDKIKAVFSNGRLLLGRETPTPKRGPSILETEGFSGAQATVTAILKNLDTTLEKDRGDAEEIHSAKDQSCTTYNNNNNEEKSKNNNDPKNPLQDKPLKQLNTKPITQIELPRNIRRVLIGSRGTNQFQIDAGQKRFGAVQCKHCGLFYSQHEPEEEKFHREYHRSLHVLRLNRWLDEDVVATFPSWAVDGRIIRITEQSHLKRQERLQDILKVIDTELGCSAYILPKVFMGFIAIRKSNVVGLCLVQPLRKANKYVCVNDVDCCTEEEFDAKCGVSRIWVSPFHRRFHIGSKLIHTMLRHTIPGENIPLDMVAFSSPTPNGIKFAKKVTNSESFLVYQ